MIINRVELLTTQLDDEYKNVYDGYSSAEQYRAMLLEKDHVSITLTPPTNRQIDINDGYTTITLDLSDTNPLTSDSVYLKNYCILHTVDKTGVKSLQFFFILSYETSGVEQVILNLKFDSWAYSYLYHLTNATKNFISRRHYNTEYNDGDERIFISNGYTVPNDTERVELVQKDTMHYRYRIIWVYLRISTGNYSAETLYTGLDDETITDISTFRQINELPILCVPYCIYDMWNRKIVNEDINIMAYRYFGDKTYRAYRFSKYPTFNQNYIIDAWFSFFSPFGYDYFESFTYRNSEGVETTARNAVVPKNLTDDDDYPDYFPASIDLDGQDMLFYIRGNHSDITTTFEINPIKVPYNIVTYKTHNLIDRLQKTYCGALNAYPNMYKYIKIGDVTIPIYNIKNTKNKQYLTIGYSGYSLYAEYRYSTENGDYKRYKFNFSFRHAISIDAYNQFMSYNANSIAVSRGLSLLGASIGLARKNVKDTVSNIGNFAQSYAHEQDVKNTIDSYINSDDFGINRFDEYLDYPVVYLSKPNEHSLLETYALFKHYGVEFNEIGNVYENFRRFYDYVQTNNCSLPSIPYNFARKEIESAFDRGVTKWHIDNYQALDDFSNRDYVDYNINNYQVNLEV